MSSGSSLPIILIKKAPFMCVFFFLIPSMYAMCRGQKKMVLGRSEPTVFLFIQLRLTTIFVHEYIKKKLLGRETITA